MRRRPSFSDALPWLFLVMVWALSFVYPYTPLDGAVLCVWRMVLDLHCPGCGLTRSFIALSAGSWSLAWNYHLAGPSLYVSMVWCIVVWALRSWTERPRLFRLPKPILFIFWGATGLLFLAQSAQVITTWTRL